MSWGGRLAYLVKRGYGVPVLEIMIHVCSYRVLYSYLSCPKLFSFTLYEGNILKNYGTKVFDLNYRNLFSITSHLRHMVIYFKASQNSEEMHCTSHVLT